MSIVSPYMSKDYLPIEEVIKVNNWPMSPSFVNNSCYKGYMHSVFGQVYYDQYIKLLSIYQSYGIYDHPFIIYGDNTTLIIITRDTNAKVTQKATIYEYMQVKPIKNYTMTYDSLCYTVDEIDKHTFSDSINPIHSYRYIASGYWVNIDANDTIYIGSQQLYASVPKLILPTAERNTNIIHAISARRVPSIPTVVSSRLEHFILSKRINNQSVSFDELYVRKFATEHKLTLSTEDRMSCIVNSN
ncbi:hypothetical protein CcNV_097 [Crangon crangon nudivirus]|uniref:Uncharacterized protein n=1 Tax=Crangon crangon nudivirus TaxID=2880838 RepID=A0AAE9BZT5_9VIRU|nr:hypothetical protein QKT25_gp098 [Crangon crangon nudivirus]UBZ25582.1 hypothetical protein CcNV_097 [Crangon crangon nudivirus]